MSERLAEVGRRIGTVRQLGAVVNAMRGIAGARAHQSRTLLPAVRAYAETAARAIGQASRLDTPAGHPARTARDGKGGLIVFGAEQGFAGAFPEQVLDAAEPEAAGRHLFLIGERAAVLAAERNMPVAWRAALPNRAMALPGLATALGEALYDYLAAVGVVPVTMIYPLWTSGRGVVVVRKSLLPLDDKAFPAAASGAAPLTNLPRGELVERLVQEYVFAQICEAAIEAFAAENEARMATMAAAKSHIDDKLSALAQEERMTRQDEITAEVIELAASGRSRARPR